MTLTNISAVVIAGGRARRMGGVDKGLQIYQDKPLFMHAVERLKEQVSHIQINANRNLDKYKESGLNVFSDEKYGYLGPLSGMLSGLNHSQSKYVAFVPCDSPHFPLDLIERLYSGINVIGRDSDASLETRIAYAYDGNREHPTFVLIERGLTEDLAYYLESGERRLLTFMQDNDGVAVDFSDQVNAFANINTLEELTGLSDE